VIDLETNDISILNLALSKRELLLHELDHAGLDFLQKSKSENCACLGILLAHLEELQRGTWCPTHSLVNQGVQILDFAVP
jgi:hypothetical protein